MTDFTPVQQETFFDRYAMKDSEGNRVENTPEEMWDRVSTAIGDTDEERTEFRTLLDSFKFVPAGRILSGAGAENEKTFYNCYVIPVETKARRENRRPANTYEVSSDYFSKQWRDPPLRDDPGADSREAIIDTIGTMVDIMSRGGGVGVNWSVLRPSGSYLNRISGTSSGPIDWMDVASTAVGTVIQGGSRRGAAMFMLDDWHPDVMKFIEAKKEKGKITNANISVAVSDAFMAAVEQGGSWEFRFPDTTDPRYDLEWDGNLDGWVSSGGRVKSYGTLPAQHIWRVLTESAHASGEPGIVFLDRYNSLSTGADVERLISVNPCGEQGLGAYSVCNLGAMNLDAYVSDRQFNYRSFRFDVQRAIRFLDNAIDKNYNFLPETADQQRKLRRIGLGVMGVADALVRLRLRYGSEESIAFIENIFREMKDAAIWSSMEIAKEKEAAGAWNNEMWERPYLAEYKARYAIPDSELRPLRNVFLLTVAPTGTTSLLAGVNGGIEPFFNTGYYREDRIGKRFVQPRVIEELGEKGILALPEYVVTAQQVSVDEHIAVQAAVQKWVDSSVSKTINAPADQTPEETARAYQLAYDQGLKGLAYYRDGSRSVQVLYHEDPNEKIKSLEAKVAELEDKLKFKNQQGSYPVGGGFAWNDALGFTPVLTFTSGHGTDCVGTVVYEEGCQKCYTCAWTAC